MLDFVRNAIVLFLKGRLFQEPRKVVMQIALGIGVTAALLVGLAGTGLPIVVSAAIAGLLGGMLQPYLFRNLKYR